MDKLRQYTYTAWLTGSMVFCLVSASSNAQFACLASIASCIAIAAWAVIVMVYSMVVIRSRQSADAESAELRLNQIADYMDWVQAHVIMTFVFYFAHLVFCRN